MRRLLEQHPPSEQLRTIGIDEISISKGHTYAIVVADLDKKRPDETFEKRDYSYGDQSWRNFQIIHDCEDINIRSERLF